MKQIIYFFQNFFLSKKNVHNPYYFFGLFLVIFFIHAWHIYLKNDAFSLIFFKLIVLAFLESIIESVSVALIATYLIGKKSLFLPFLFLISFFPVIHLMDFILERLFNLSIWQAALSFLSESMENMLELLYATNIPLYLWFIGFGFLGLLGILFIKIHHGINYFSKKFPTGLKAKHLFSFLLAACLLHVPIKKGLNPLATLSQSDLKVLPFKSSFSPNINDLSHVHVRDESFEFINSKSFSIGGNLYLFIIESLRDEAINSEVSPHLTKMGKTHFRHPQFIASANATQLSWYSIFHSKPSIFWNSSLNQGSPLLEKLQKEGYDTYVISSPRLSYYNMDKSIMGSSHELVKEYVCPKLTRSLSAFEADEACFEEMKKRHLLEGEKKAFIVFLDATHFGYSLPSKKQFPFHPYVESIPYISTLFTRKDISGIKNRYYNAIYSLDELFGNFFDFLKERKAFDSSLICVTADHGEEFKELGQIFHASQLSNYQIHVPFILKTPHSYKGVLDNSNFLSHEEIAPLIQSVMTNQNFTNPSSVVSARFLFSKTPKEAVIINKTNKALCEVSETSKKLTIKALFDRFDNSSNSKTFGVFDR